MWTFFWFNNIHFAIEIFSAVILLMLAWLVFDGFILDREWKTAVLSLGFFCYFFWSLVNALGLENDFILWLALGLYLLGLLLIVLYSWKHSRLKKPAFNAIFILPAMSSVLFETHIIATALFALIIIFTLLAYKESIQKALRPFIVAMFLLMASSIVAIFSSKTSGFSNLWIAEHSLKFLGFAVLAYWGWQYIRVRIKEELLLIFVSMALFISIIVSFTFSAILLKNMENEAEANLVINARVLNFSISEMKKEALYAVKVVAVDSSLKNILATKDYTNLKKVSQDLMTNNEMDFLTLADNEGNVILRAHSATLAGDTINNEEAGRRALAGNSNVTVEDTQVTGLAIRSAAPIYDTENNLLGVAITGFILDNTFVDKLKNRTGLEAAVYKGNKLRATTVLGPDGTTRNIGAKQTDPRVAKTVLGAGQGIVVNTTIFSRPYLVAYLPLQNADGEIIGLLESARPQVGLAGVAARASHLTLLITVIIALMFLLPIYFLSKKIVEEI